MKVNNIEVKNTDKRNKRLDIIEFATIQEFYEYISKTEINYAFAHRSLSSKTGSYNFTGTNSYEEAVNLFRNGWKEMAAKLNKKLNQKINSTVYGTQRKQVYSQAGYQVSVGRYLQGNPCNMINIVNKPIKQKVIEINKSIDYNASTSKEKILDESVKALQIVSKLESQGMRVKLNIVLGSMTKSFGFVIKVCIKNSNERFNVSKMAFPLVNPSMLRRLMFKFIEVYPKITNDFAIGYGSPAKTELLKEVFEKEYLIPNFVSVNVNDINGLEDLQKI